MTALLVRIGLWILDQVFAKDPQNRTEFIALVNAARARGLVDVKRRYKSEAASQTVEDRWDEIEKQEQSKK